MFSFQMYEFLLEYSVIITRRKPTSNKIYGLYMLAISMNYKPPFHIYI